jgi:hypothetical protein
MLILTLYIRSFKIGPENIPNSGATEVPSIFHPSAGTVISRWLAATLRLRAGKAGPVRGSRRPRGR